MSTGFAAESKSSPARAALEIVTRDTASSPSVAPRRVTATRLPPCASDDGLTRWTMQLPTTDSFTPPCSSVEVKTRDHVSTGAGADQPVIAPSPVIIALMR